MWGAFGQDSVLEHLASAVKKDTLHHAYLFTGPEKTGKKLMALDLARALNCELEDSPCGVCESCRRINASMHADVRLLDLASHGDESGVRKEIKTEEIEDIQHSANLPPFEGKTKVFIIDGAEALSSFAANRLLKTLEEPPPQVVFVLLSPSLESVLPTIVSRCQHLEFRNIAYRELASYLSQRFGVDEVKASTLSHLSGGRPGWAITALEDESFLADFLKNRDKLLGLYQASREERFIYAEKIAARFAVDRLAVTEELKSWRTLTRDILFVQFDLADNVINRDVLEQLETLANNYKPFDVRNILGAINMARNQLQCNVSPRLVLETMMLALECPGEVAIKF